MEKILKKLHISEILLLVAYGVFIVACLLYKEFHSLLTIVVFVSGVLAVLSSIWSMAYRRCVLPIVWPLHIFFGYLVGFCFFSPSSLSGGPAAVWMAVCFMVLVVTFVQIIFCLYFARKDFLKMSLMMIGGCLVAYLIDDIFISPQEYGEKGRIYLLEKYSAWRILDESSFFRF